MGCACVKGANAKVKAWKTKGWKKLSKKRRRAPSSKEGGSEEQTGNNGGENSSCKDGTETGDNGGQNSSSKEGTETDDSGEENSSSKEGTETGDSGGENSSSKEGTETGDSGGENSSSKVGTETGDSTGENSSSKEGVETEAESDGADESTISPMTVEESDKSIRSPLEEGENEFDKARDPKPTRKETPEHRPQGDQQQPQVGKSLKVRNGKGGVQDVAGWPSWLSSVAGEALEGWMPRKLESFEKLDKIGQGTYSIVYRACDHETRKTVALKKVHFQSMNQDSVQFMAREIIILRKLDHPNVMKLEGLIASKFSSTLYLVFEYMEHDLAGLAASHKLTERQIKCYMQQLFRGLEHCHNHGVLHRDIKSSNLMIGSNGTLKIGDFGLATFFRPGEKQDLTSCVVTLWYRPPELLLGATNYGVGIDLWSSGCILAELFAGKPIMPGRTEVEQMHKIFKLCGSPPEKYWKNSKSRHAEIFKPARPYRRRVAEAFWGFPPSALNLLEMLLAFAPEQRGTATSALESEFFLTDPLPCDPSYLPKYPSCKEMNVKRQIEAAQRRNPAGRRASGHKSSRHNGHESRAASGGNSKSELKASKKKGKGQSMGNLESYNLCEDGEHNSHYSRQVGASGNQKDAADEGSYLNPSEYTKMKFERSDKPKATASRTLKPGNDAHKQEKRSNTRDQQMNGSKHSDHDRPDKDDKEASPNEITKDQKTESQPGKCSNENKQIDHPSQRQNTSTDERSRAGKSGSDKTDHHSERHSRSTVER